MIHRRQIALLASIVVISSASCLAADFFPTSARREGFLKALARQDANYDETAKMLAAEFSSPGYHTTLDSGTVHRTRDSLIYAVALLDSGDPNRLERAEQILDRVIDLQDQDPASRTYGIWSWFLEEPLDQMSPPDWNWADFCGTQLLQVAIDHMDRLPAELQEKVRRSILHAARSIQRRNVGPGYTNIAIMGTYVTLLAGEQFKDKELFDYGKKRLGRFRDYTQEKGSFSEYNSPTYTVVAINELSRILAHVKDEESKRFAEDLNGFAWYHLARHFHAPTKQWAGPHSRAYSTMLRPSVLAFIQRGTKGQVSFVPEAEAYDSIDAHRLPVACPADLFPYFLSLTEPREEIETFVLNPEGEHDLIGRTYLHPDFTVGSINCGDLWNQRRPLVAYWNTPSGPAAMRIRFLHDGYDYSSASIFTIQDAAELLGAVVFATDRGDTHISLDRIANGTIQARDLRMRLQFEGAIDDLKLPYQVSIGDPIEFGSGGMEAQFCVHTARIDDLPVRMETGRDADGAWIDVVLYNGVSREFNFNKIVAAGVVFTLSMTKSTSPIRVADPAVFETVAGTMIVEGELLPPRARWQWRRQGKTSLILTVPMNPLPTKRQMTATTGQVDIEDRWKSFR